MRTLALPALFCVLALQSTGCNRTTTGAAPQTQPLNAEPTELKLPPVQYVFRPDNTLKYRVDRLNQVAGGVTSDVVHEIHFFSANGKTKEKTQNFLVGFTNGNLILSLSTSYRPDKTVSEKRHFDINTKTVNKIEYFDSAGKCTKTEEFKDGTGPTEDVPQDF